MPSEGCFIAVVGPSGAGKDSLINAARAHFGHDGPVRFVRRTITRPAAAGGEAHLAMNGKDFSALLATGGFALSWSAHGLQYGIPADIGETLAEGRAVLANLSRTVLPDLRASYGRRIILCVTASPEVLANRLVGRGRESRDQIAARLRRAECHQPEGLDVVTIRNDADLQSAESAFIAAVTAALEDPATHPKS